MRSRSYDHMLKLLMVGDSAVGKTSLLVSFADGDFDDDQKSTIGVDLKMKMMNLRKKTLKLTIWDTAGQERFRTLVNAYYRGAHGIILVYDVTRPETFTNIQTWLNEVDLYSTNSDAVRMLVANKIDLEDQAITHEQGVAFAKEHSMLFIETSARTREGVEQAFEELVLKIMDFPSLLEGDSSGLRVDASSQSDTDIGLCGAC